jgi:hypothetical protein
MIDFIAAEGKSKRAVIAMILLYGLALYVFLGVVTAVAFVLFGLARVLPQSASVTVAARILLLPGATALWPYVLLRWLKSRDTP